MIELALLAVWSLLCVRLGWWLRRRWHFWHMQDAVARIMWRSD